MPSSLDPSEASRLVAAFLKTDAMSRRRTRDLLLATLNRELGHVLPISRHAEDMYDMYEIVDVCLAYPGTIHALITIIERFHPGSRSVKAVRDLVEELLPHPLLEPAERRDLYRLADALDRGALDTDDRTMLSIFYREAVGEFGPSLTGVVHSVRDVLAQLEEAPNRPDRALPLLWFTALLADRARSPVGIDLCAWNERLADRIKVTVPRPRALFARRRAEEQAHLVIECRPDGVDPHGYLTSAWLQFPREHGISLLREDVPRRIDELPALVENLLVTNPQVVNRHIHKLVIEFVLPRDLLSLPFDQYPYAPGGLRRRLGLDHPVVVRSLERMRNRQLQQTCRRKWDHFQQSPGGAMVTWVSSPGQYELEQLYALLSEHSQACLALSYQPRGSSASVDEFHVGLQAGTPIVLWCRTGADPAHFVPGVRDLLKDDLMSLPAKIQELRRRAAQTADAGHLGNHLTLLFEDTERLPEPYISLRSPH